MSGILEALIFVAGALVGHSIRHLRCCEERSTLLEETRKLLDEAQLRSNLSEENHKTSGAMMEEARQCLADAEAFFEKEKEQSDKLIQEIQEFHRSERERLAKA